MCFFCLQQRKDKSSYFFSGGDRVLAMRDFFVSYRKTKLDSSEVVVSVDIPFSTEHDHVHAFKLSKRKDDDLAIVTSCFYVRLDEQRTVTDSCIAFGGVSAVPVGSSKTSSAILGKTWDRSMVELLQTQLAAEHLIPTSVPGGVPEYRRAAVASTALKFVFHVLHELQPEEVAERERSAIQEVVRPVSASNQVFEAALVNKGDGVDTVGKPKKHLSALEQASEHITSNACVVDRV